MSAHAWCAVLKWKRGTPRVKARISPEPRPRPSYWSRPRWRELSGLDGSFICVRRPECARPARAGDRPRRLGLPLQDAHVVDIAGEGVAAHCRLVAARLPADCQLPRVRDRAARAGQRLLADAVDDYCHRVSGAITPDRVPRTVVDLRRGEDGPLLIVSATEQARRQPVVDLDLPIAPCGPGLALLHDVARSSRRPEPHLDREVTGARFQRGAVRHDDRVRRSGARPPGRERVGGPAVDAGLDERPHRAVLAVTA